MARHLDGMEYGDEFGSIWPGPNALGRRLRRLPYLFTPRLEVSRVRTLGMGGPFISLPNPPPVDTNLRLTFEVAGGNVRAEAIVRNIVRGEGMRVEFTRMDLKDRVLLQELLKPCYGDTKIFEALSPLATVRVRRAKSIHRTITALGRNDYPKATQHERAIAIHRPRTQNSFDATIQLVRPLGSSS